MEIKEEILEQAQKLLPGCDWIVDLYDLMMIWVSQKAIDCSGYTKEECLAKRNLDFMSSRYDEEQIRVELAERITKVHGKKSYVIETKQGEKNLKFSYYAFKIGGGEYLAGKILSIEKL